MLIVGGVTTAFAEESRAVFRDLPVSDPDHAVVEQAVREGAISWPGLEFRADQVATVYEWTAVVAGLMDALGIEDETKALAPVDVPGDHWAAPRVARVVGVVGMPRGGRFDGERVVTAARVRDDMDQLARRVEAPRPSYPEWLGGAAPVTRRVVARAAVLALVLCRKHQEAAGSRLAVVEQQTLVLASEAATLIASVGAWETGKEPREGDRLRAEWRRLEARASQLRRDLDAVRLGGRVRAQGKTLTKRDRENADALLKQMESEITAVGAKLGR